MSLNENCEHSKLITQSAHLMQIAAPRLKRAGNDAGAAIVAGSGTAGCGPALGWSQGVRQGRTERAVNSPLLLLLPQFLRRVCAVIMRALCWIHNRYCMDMLGRWCWCCPAARRADKDVACSLRRSTTFLTFALCMNWAWMWQELKPVLGQFCLLLRPNCDNII